MERDCDDGLSRRPRKIFPKPLKNGYLYKFLKFYLFSYLINFLPRQRWQFFFFFYWFWLFFLLDLFYISFWNQLNSKRVFLSLIHSKLFSFHSVRSRISRCVFCGILDFRVSFFPFIFPESRTIFNLGSIDFLINFFPTDFLFIYFYFLFFFCLKRADQSFLFSQRYVFQFGLILLCSCCKRIRLNCL